MSTISTHVLDTSLGKPAAGIRVTLRRDNSLIGSGTTDEDGRVRDLLEKDSALTEGDYTLSFSVADYFAKTKRDTFYSDIQVNFRIGAGSGHYHVPLLLSPFGYSTYRGS
ncbi:MAG TPA: hydroxyisourate hydrolase [Gemmatimonadaceae bacterium]|nr:hydroxyisourate hydrolase [Gemmatimonadaceae bacterium]